MVKPLHFFRKSSPLIRFLSLGLFALVGTLLAVLIMRISTQQTPSVVWLPNTDKTSDEQAYYNVLVRAKTTPTKYGTAWQFDSIDKAQDGRAQDPVTTIYEFKPSAALQEASCPNILGAESLLPSPCSQVGTLHGHPVYAISRRLPSMTTEYFVRVDDVFIFVKAGVDGQPSPTYIKTFERLTRSQVGAYIQKNKQRMDRLYAKDQTAAAAEKTKDAAAYSKLTFTPALPQKLPAGWKLNVSASESIAIDGPDSDHPTLISASYVNAHEQYIQIHSLPMATSALGSQCGPTPGDGMQRLYCVKSIGKNYYESSRMLDSGDLVRYLYYQVGDSLVVSQLLVISSDGKPVVWPTELAQAQDDLVQSAQPIDKNSLKGYSYHRSYYY